MRRGRVWAGIRGFRDCVLGFGVQGSGFSDSRVRGLGDEVVGFQVLGVGIGVVGTGVHGWGLKVRGLVLMG